MGSAIAQTAAQAGYNVYLKYIPCQLLRKMVTAGYLGRKSGKGFFQY
jgi:3-hydroxyacyl-CoA dehydrogenase